MLKLVRKDLRVSWMIWLPALFFAWIFLLTFFEYAPAELVVGILWIAGVAGSFLYLDEMSRTDPLIAALPLTRRDIVRGRYLTTVVVIGAGLAFFMGGIASIRALLGARAAHLESLLSVQNGLIMAVSVLLLAFLFLPMYFRLGLGRAFARLAVILLGLSIILPGLAQLAAPLVLQSGTGEAAGLPQILLAVPAVLKALLEKARAALGGAVLASLVSVFCGLLFLLSFLLSVRFYRQRDL